MKKNNFTNFVIDIGDTLGGILLGLSLDAESNAMMLFGSLLIIASIYFKYFNKEKGQKDNDKKYTIEKIIEHLKELK